MLFYKSEIRENTGERPPYEINVQVKSDQTTDKDFELLLN